MKNIKRVFTLLLCVGLTYSVSAQSSEVKEEKKYKNAWEFGIGASVTQFSRVDFTGFNKVGEDYQLGLNLRHAAYGPNLYVARQLSRFFYLDLQGSAGFTKQYVNGKDKWKGAYMVGPGLQWRFAEYFKSQYIDPFLRVGVNYMYKNFDMRYNGVVGNDIDDMNWNMENNYNKEGADRRHLIPIALGAGTHAWLNDRFGLGAQLDYLIMPHKDVANSWQGTIRVLWRFGGKSKKAAPVYIEKIVQAPPVIQEKVVTVEVPAQDDLTIEVCDLFNNVYFAFDKSDIRQESEETLDRIADLMKADTSRRFLITGYTDARGSATYNIGLSRRRAAAVVEALEKRGVPSEMIKSRGVGKNISYAPVSESHIVREGDRKVTAEIVTKKEYWDFMPKRDY